MLATPDEPYNEKLNLMLRLASDFMDHWSPVSAEIVNLALTQPNIFTAKIGGATSYQAISCKSALEKGKMAFSKRAFGILR